MMMGGVLGVGRCLEISGENEQDWLGLVGWHIVTQVWLEGPKAGWHGTTPQRRETSRQA